MRESSISMAALLLIVLVGCAKPQQTPEEARKGFAALFEKNDPSDVERYVFSDDPETLSLLKAVLTRMRDRETAMGSGAGSPGNSLGSFGGRGLPAPQAGLMAALSKGIVKAELPPVVEERQDGDRLVQRYSNGRSASFRLVARRWKLDLDATEPGQQPFKERLRAMQGVLATDAGERGSAPPAR